jgi:glycosyltransferase involved in cell wall biosynthesis
MADKTRILMTADTIGGVWTYTMQLCAALEAHSTEVHLLTLGAPLNVAQREQVAALANVVLYESRFKLEWMSEPWKDVSFARQWIDSVYAEVQPDILHFNNYVRRRRSWKCPVVTVFHSCVLSWWESVRRQPLPASWSGYKEHVSSALLESDCVIFPTEALRQQAGRFYSDSLRSMVIANGLENPGSNTGHKLPFILSAGRLWDEAKNTSLLCTIADTLSWPVQLAGKTESITSPGQSNNISFLGQLDQQEMKAKMEEAAIFCMPAKYEPFGLAVLEAAAAGCALALGDIPTLREIWQDAAVYFDPFDDHKAAETIEMLIADTDLRTNLGLKAKRRAQQFSAKTMAANYATTYNLLAKNGEILTTNSYNT